jgi:hypothetical protein
VYSTPITFNFFNFIFNFIPITITTFKMKFSIVAASLVALAAAHNLPAPEETCSASVTVTVTHYAYASLFPMPPFSSSNKPQLCSSSAHPLRPRLPRRYGPGALPHRPRWSHRWR